MNLDTLTGKHKRCLRSIAAKLKNENNIAVLQCKQSTVSFRENLNSVLVARELVQIKVHVDKKKLAKDLGIELAQATNSLLAQTVGHTILLYRPSEPAGLITIDLLKKMETM